MANYNHNPIQPKQLLSPGETRITSHWWHLNSSGYAARTERVGYGQIKGIRRKGKTILAHIEVMEEMIGRALLPGEQVDHDNGIRLDNRRGNLFLVTQTQNAQNLHHKDGLRGVTFNKETQRFAARVWHLGKNYFVGNFFSPYEAAWESSKKRYDLGVYRSVKPTTDFYVSPTMFCFSA